MMETRDTDLFRRRLLVIALGAAAAPWLATASDAATELPLTPSQPEGPFYPRTLPADRDADLLVVAGRPGRAEGTPLYLTGTVRSRDGRLLADALVEIWQCDALGRYHHVGDGSTAPRDDNFQGYGQTPTDAEGRYRFRTIRPVAYPGRTPHIHFKVSHPAARPLTTQMYVAGDRGEDAGVLRWFGGGETRERLSVTLTPASSKEPNALAGEFDIVLATGR